MRAYQYVGPPEVRTAAESAVAGQVIGTPDDLGAWLSGCGRNGALEPLTFVIDVSGICGWLRDIVTMWRAREADRS